MIKPSFLEPGDQPAMIGKAFGVPLVVKGKTGLPLIELLAWAILSWVAGRQRPDWSLANRMVTGAINSSFLLGAEWCHNLAHAAAAAWIGKPADAIRNFWGAPLLVYFEASNQGVTPRQHQLRALGGPVFNFLMHPLLWITQQITRKGSLAHYAASFALHANSAMTILSLSPLPFLDGGSLLKWSSVERGRTPQEADELVRSVNRLVGYGSLAASGLALKRRRAWLAAGLMTFAVTTLAVGYRILRE